MPNPLCTNALTFPAILLSCCLGARQASAQTVVHSTNGYQVNISTAPVALEPHTFPCTWGYNYDVQLSYAVTFTGTNIPAHMYTLQGEVGCGSSSLFFNLPNTPSSGMVTTTGNAWRGVADCNTATLASIGCDEVTVQIHGPGISNRYVHIDATTLPITLVSFSAAPKADRVELNWTTASEQDNAFFTVERSADAFSFSPVLQLSGSGNSSQMIDYSAMDENPLPGISYYRLRQTDFDGSTTLSSVVAVEAKGERKALSVFPNPGNAPVIELPPNTIGEELTIRSIAGEIVFSGTLNSNNFQATGLRAGTYLLSVTDPRTGISRQCRLVRL